MGSDRKGHDTDCPIRVFWSLIVQGRKLRRMWMNPERIGEDSESRVRFFRSSNNADRIVSPTQVDLERHRNSLGLCGQLLGDGTQTNLNPYTDIWVRHVDQNRRDQSQASCGGPDLTWSLDAVLTDTVARLRWDLDEMNAESRYLRTPGVRDSLRQPTQVTFTSIKVLKFADVTSWEQYRQVFDAIVLSNGWDDATAALQLLSHLEGTH